LREWRECSVLPLVELPDGGANPVTKAVASAAGAGTKTSGKTGAEADAVT
jgi:hypothetical protein